MQAAGRTDIELVLTGVGALSAGIDQGLWVKVLPDHAAKFPNVLDNYLPAARRMTIEMPGRVVATISLRDAPGCSTGATPARARSGSDSSRRRPLERAMESEGTGQNRGF